MNEHKAIRITKLLLIEDGSVDLTEVEEYLKAHGILPITYRQGSTAPQLIEIENVVPASVSAFGFNEPEDSDEE